MGLALFLLLAVFMVVGKGINALLGRPAVNWAAAFLVVAVVLFGLAIVNASGSPEAMGFVIGSYLLPVAVAVWLAFRFRRESAPPANDQPSMFRLRD